MTFIDSGVDDMLLKFTSSTSESLLQLCLEYTLLKCNPYHIVSGFKVLTVRRPQFWLNEIEIWRFLTEKNNSLTSPVRRCGAAGKQT